MQILDHVPIKLRLILDHQSKARPFRFLKIWIRTSICKDVVGVVWMDTGSRDRVVSVRYKIHNTSLTLKK